jgi:hypothetical protein
VDCGQCRWCPKKTIFSISQDCLLILKGGDTYPGKSGAIIIVFPFLLYKLIISLVTSFITILNTQAPTKLLPLCKNQYHHPSAFNTLGLGIKLALASLMLAKLVPLFVLGSKRIPGP